MVENEIERAIQEKNLVFGLARSTPVFVINGRIYYCSPDASPNLREVMRIKEGPRLEVIERISNLRLQGDYMKFQEKFIAKELGERENRNVSNSYRKLVQFAMKDVFPYLRKENDRALNEVLETSNELKLEEKGNGDYEKEIENYVSDRIKEVERKRKTHREIQETKIDRLDRILLNGNFSRSTFQDSLFMELMNGYNFGIYGQRYFTLANVDRNENISVGGNKYALILAGDFAKLRDDFTSEVVNGLATEALRYKLQDSEEFRKLRSERSDLDVICSKTSYHEIDFGFEKESDNFTIYVDVPEHALKDPINGQLYRFEGHKLGLSISSGGNFQIMGGPHSVGKLVSGPFYNGGGSALCMGNYTLGYFENMTRGKAIAKYLVDARNVVLHGFSNSAIRAFHPLERFANNHITRAEATRLEIPITNETYEGGVRNNERDYW